MANPGTALGCLPPSHTSASFSLKMASSLLEADPLTIAKQLTRMEADLFKKATPAEFVRRIIHAQIPTGDANDITPIINLSGKVGELTLILTYAVVLWLRTHKIALWAVESILESEDVKERGRVLKFFITVADVGSSLRMNIPRKVHMNPMHSTVVRYATFRAWFLSSVV